LSFLNEKLLESPEMSRKWIRIFSKMLPYPSHVSGENSAGVDGWLSKGSTVHRPWSENPHWHQQNIWPEQRVYFSFFLPRPFPLERKWSTCCDLAPGPGGMVAMPNGPIKGKQVNQSSSVIG
jgi:hypothetical protein